MKLHDVGLRRRTTDNAGMDYLLEHLVIAGTPDQVARQIFDFRERVGPLGTLLYAGIDWAEPDLARRSMELMATEVMPRVNHLIRAS